MKRKLRKIYAYSDNDGFIRFNAIGGKDKALWNMKTKEYIHPEPQHDIDLLPLWVAVIISLCLGVAGVLY